MQSIPAAQPKNPFRFGRLSSGDKATIGFGLFVASLLAAVLIAGIGAHAARTGAGAMKDRHLPVMETLLSLETLLYETVFHAGMFDSSGDMANYSGARIRFAAIRGALSDLAEKSPEDKDLARDMDSLRGLTRRLDLGVEKRRTLRDAFATEEARLRRCADDIGEILLDFQARAASVAASGKGGEGRDKTFNPADLNEFALAVETATGQATAACARKSLDALAEAGASFTWHWLSSAREACAAAALLPVSGSARGGAASLEETARLVAAFNEIMKMMRFTLEESARVSEDRAEITERLTALVRGLTAKARANLEIAADRTDAALAGVAAVLFAGAILACILAVGAVFVFVRTRSASRSSPAE